MIKTNIIIAGGGPAGCAIAATLAQNNISVVCVDQDNPKDVLKENFDGRTTAISYGSHFLFKEIGVWDPLLNQACPIHDIKVTESGSPVLLDFLAKDTNADAFGWIVENKRLRSALYQKLGELKNCTHIAPARIVDYKRTSQSIIAFLENGKTIEADLVIGADGRKSFTRQWAGIETRGWGYNQRAIVCVISHKNPHNNIAIEDFRSDGPFAMLPMNDSLDGHHRSSLVWTEHGRSQDSALEWDISTFNTAINERIPDSYGVAHLHGKRFSYPLSLGHAHSYIADKIALIADAAHGIHPIAGQGLNLGIRDVRCLSELLISAKNENEKFGSKKLLLEYERSRKADNMMMAGATDILNKLFSNDLSSARILRKMGLKLVQKIPSVKQFFMNQAMGKQINRR